MSKRTFVALLIALPVFVYSYITGTSIPWSWRAAFSLLILAPIAEELVFRGVLQDYLAKKLMNPWLAIVLVSAIFALLHFAISREPARLLVFFPSVVIGWHYQRERSLPLVMLIHSFYNINAFV